MSRAVTQTVPLDFQWATVDPFLFCVHHLDHYPAGNDRLGPAGPLHGRDLGQDFAGIDGWRMYHGLEVPGFPQHPHRGFETITFVRRGYVDHSDSLGATARYGRGDVQWMTAGAGIVHAEMFPLVDPDGPNPLELFQIWLNLPSSDKMVDPYFTMMWDERIPRVTSVDDAGRRVEFTVVAGRLGDVEPPPPPPSSWAARPEADLAVWHVDAAADAQFTLPPARDEHTVRTIYVFSGGGLDIDGEVVASSTGAVVDVTRPLAIKALADVQCLLLQGRPIGEPVAQYGPFVMNDRAGIEQAFRDYQRTQFGGWPWIDDAPVHPRDAGRFARHVGGRIDRPVEPAEPIAPSAR
jgi:redox-sensitive bicupin YhaK (pirin superfamily)